MKKQMSLKSFHILAYVTLFVLISSSMYYQYAIFNKMTKEYFQSDNYNKSFAVREKFRLLFDKIQYDFIKSENENLTKFDELNELYNNDKEDLNLTRIANRLNENVDFGKYQVFLINRDYIIEKASYKKEIGYDLGQFKVVQDLFDDLYAKKINIDVSSPKLDSDFHLKRYIIKLSEDEKYILQLAFSLDYKDELQKQLAYLMSDSMKVQLYLETDFFVQELGVEPKRSMEMNDYMEYCKTTTKNFLFELNLAFKNKKTENLLQSSSKNQDMSLKVELRSILPSSDKLLSYMSNNTINYFSATDSLFGESSDIILFIKTSFSLEPLNNQLAEGRYAFQFVIILLILILLIYQYFTKKELSLKIISITKKIKNNETIEDERSFFKEISTLIASYNKIFEKLNQQIKINKDMSYIDALTKVKNRKAFDEKLVELVSSYERYEYIFSMLILDIDDFKKVNDNYGHAVGDVVLKSLAKLLESIVRSTDIVCRIGGEEFVIIFPHTSLADSLPLVQEIHLKIKNNFISDIDANVTVSIGATEIISGDSPDSIFRRVDSFLYNAKKSGKDKIMTQ